MEFIHEAEAERVYMTRKDPKDFDSVVSEENYIKNLRRAIQCLVLAMVKE